jgi:hypothetical protein
MPTLSPTLETQLFLSIRGRLYGVRSTEPAPGASVQAWRLVSQSGDVYDVCVGSYGVACSCGDFTWRREHRDPLGCKHVQALKQVGLLR